MKIFVHQCVKIRQKSNSFFLTRTVTRTLPESRRRRLQATEGRRTAREAEAA
eukprot:COSAG04_NODE_3519_length_2745_cov_2.839380_2_plen_52_part_00